MSKTEQERVGSLRFRSDVQGLRALAVLLVIGSHLGGFGLPGGYVGVDVFFVVSGFLITLLLLKEAQRSGRISLTDFYSRRARRILPAATLVTVATVVGSVTLLALTRAQTVVIDAIWTALFGANVRFALVGTDYFAEGEPPSPLQHYWSLAVEEQFYLIWPLVVALVTLLSLRRGWHRDRTLAVVLVVTVALSLTWSVLATHDSPTTAYFSTFTRAWELGVGAGCALLVHAGLFSAQRPVLPRWLLETLGVLGLVGIAWSARFLTAAIPFPGIVAAVPVLGAAAIILAGVGRTSLVGRLLSVRPAVAVGDWSYSLYLWHWPVIILFRSYFGPGAMTTTAKLALFVAMLVASWASYRWVETPFRTGTFFRPRLRSLVVYPASVALVVGVALAGSASITYRLGGFDDSPQISTADFQSATLDGDPAVALVQASVLAARQRRAVPSDLTPPLAGLRGAVAPLGECDYRDGTRKLCNEGDPDAERSIVVIGDSHARAWSPAIHEVGRRLGYGSYALVYSGCQANGLVQIDKETGEPWQECTDFKQWVLETVERLDPALVIVSSSVGRYVDPATNEEVVPGDSPETYLPVLQEGIRLQLEALQPLGDRVVVLGNTPRLPRETGVCLSTAGADLGDCLFQPGPRATRYAKAAFEAASETGVGAVDARDWFCADGGCPSVVGDFITMRDKEHVTPEYARHLAVPLARRLGLDRAAD